MIVLRVGWRGVTYLLLLAGATALIVIWWAELSRIWSEHLLTFTVITLLMASAILVQARNFTSFLSPRSGTLCLATMTHAWALGVLANYVGPFQPGVALRVALLARLGVPVAESSIATLRQIFASLWLALLIAGVSLLSMGSRTMALPALVLLVTFALVSQTLPMLSRLAARILSRRNATTLARHVETSIALPNTRSAFGILLQYGLSAAVFFVGYSRFGVDISIAAALALACVVQASSVVALFPGNFGVLEALCTAFGQIHGLPVDQSLALAFLYRGANLASALLLAAIPGPFEAKAR